MDELNEKLTGTGVALVTPFAADKSVDYKALAKLVTHVMKGRVEYLVVLGTTGESVTLTRDERQKVVATVVQTVLGKMPVVLGLGGNNTQEILDALKDPYDFKYVDAILSVSPYYNKPSQRGIYEHYKAIAQKSPKPIILYNVPARTGSNISAETTLKLAKDFKNIIGIKEASGNLEQCMKIIKNRPKDFLVISGDDMLTIPICAVGGNGAISVVANAFPKDYSHMTRMILSEDVVEAKRVMYKLTDIIEQLFADGNPAGIKAALEVLNVCKSVLRLPLVNVNPETQKKIEELVKAYR